MVTSTSATDQNPGTRIPILAWGTGLALAACAIAAGAFAYSVRKENLRLQSLLEPARVEKEATESLKELADYVTEIEFGSDGTHVNELRDGRFAKHKYQILRSGWIIKKDAESAAYPFVGRIQLTFKRWATVAKSSKAEAEADDTFYLNNVYPPGWRSSAYDAKEFERYCEEQILTNFHEYVLYWDLLEGEWVERD